MLPSSNLISESILINAAIEYLRSVGNRSTAVKVIDRVMNISRPDHEIARRLAEDLAARDPRLRVTDDIVEYLPVNYDPLELHAATFVVLDLETTGAKAPPCRVTEIGAFKVSDGKVIDDFQTLVDPETPIPAFITGLTGISNEMVATAPKFREISGRLLEFIGDSVMVAHNAPFDMSFLNHEIGRVYEDYRLANPALCTVQLSRRLLPDIENHKLNTVARHYEIDLRNHHRAGDDAFATAHIFLNLLGSLGELGITDYGSARRLSLKKLRRAAATGKQI